jgi:ankyrin repeat protein
MAEEHSAELVRELRQIRYALLGLMVVLALAFVSQSIRFWTESTRPPDMTSQTLGGIQTELGAIRGELSQQRTSRFPPLGVVAANPDNKSKLDAFMKAADEGQVGRMEQLLKEGINVNDKDADGQTALMHAAAKGQVAVAKALLDHKALMAEQDKLGQTAAIKAAKNGQRAVLILLKDRHTENEQHNTIYQLWAIRDNEGRSALMHAAMEGHAEIVSDLMYAMERDDVNSPSLRDSHGKTALMYAAERGHAGVVRAMLTNFFKLSPAYLDLTDKDGKTASQLAEEKGHKDVVSLLKK